MPATTSWRLASLFFLGLFFCYTDAYTCTQKTNNKCAAECVEDGVTITLDISNIVNYPKHISVDSSSPDAENVDSFVFSCDGRDNQCDISNQKTSVCMTDTNSEQYSCGSAEIADWDLIKTEPAFLYTITYGGGSCQGLSCKRSVFNFVQTNNEDDVSVHFTRADMDGSVEVYVFDVSGPCVGQSNCALSKKSGSIAGYVGLSLIILVIIGIGGYFSIGSLYMYYGRGARGLEVIPNVGFWCSIPGLIKDGCMCIIHPKTNRPAYDQV